MKMLLPLICMVAYVLAEPPVGDSYASAVSHSHDHGQELSDDNQRSISQEYGPPNRFSARNLPTQYGPPRTRSNRPSHSQGSSRLAQDYSAPNGRTPSQQYGPPSSRLSQTYGAPNARNNPSEEYGVSALRDASQNYLPPAKSSDFAAARGHSDSFSARSPSSLYGAPEGRTPSNEYGVPTQKSGKHSSSFRSQFSAQIPSDRYGTPAGRANDIDQSFSAPRSFKPSVRVSQSYGAPRGQSTSFGSQPLSNYGVPGVRSADSYSQGFDPSESYGVPNQRDLQDTYGAPEARGLSQEYGVPSARSNLKTSALASSYDNARSSPSSTYGVPNARDAMPADQYGPPEQYNNLSNQGYDYARALDDLLNQEPANYDFGYKVNDFESGSDFGHTETRQENKAEGAYFVVLPDGTKQTVEYEADERGFKPRISVEPVDLGRSSQGYDDNASDLSRSGDGPY